MTHNRKYSRTHYRRGLLDFAYICACCGEIRLGAPAADPRNPPDPPVVRCKVCHRREWIESVVPAFDPAVTDAERGENFSENALRAHRAKPRRPFPDYYNSGYIDPDPRHWEARRGIAPSKPRSQE